jgi:hypothetical protein
MRCSCFPSFVIVLLRENDSSAPDKHHFCHRAIYSKPAAGAMPRCYMAGRHRDMPGPTATSRSGRADPVQAAFRAFAERAFAERVFAERVFAELSSPNLTYARAGSINKFQLNRRRID